MSSNMSHTEGSASFEIRFQSLFNEGRGLAFPCDAGGRVNLDSLSDRGRNNYLFARAMVGDVQQTFEPAAKSDEELISTS